MNIREFYGKINADYDEVLNRLSSEKIIGMFVKKFASGDEHKKLNEALGSNDYEEAFTQAHSLKGVSANMGFSGLYKASSDLCEELRGGKPQIDLSEMLAKVTEEYNLIISEIANLDQV